VTHWEGVEILTTCRGVVVVAITTTPDLLTIEGEGLITFPCKDTHLLHMTRFILLDWGFPKLWATRSLSAFDKSRLNRHHRNRNVYWNFNHFGILVHISHDEDEDNESTPHELRFSLVLNLHYYS